MRVTEHFKSTNDADRRAAVTDILICLENNNRKVPVTHKSKNVG